MRWRWLVPILAITLTACQDDGSTCTDLDEDGYGPGCSAGMDCDDDDADNWASCSTCLDSDGDGSFAGCDAYAMRTGPDCDDADDAAFPGAAPLDAPFACMRDADGDDYGDPVAPTSGLAGTDCDDADPNNFASCATCTDADSDLDYAGCDAYVTVFGPDCDDANPARSSIEPEIADDGVDNDCDGRDTVATGSLNETFVDVNGVTCSDASPQSGSLAVPYCTLPAALISLPGGGNVFVAAGSYPIDSISVSMPAAVRVYGGYDASTWTRDLIANPTTIVTDRAGANALSITAPTVVVDGFEWVRTSPIGLTAFELMMTATDVASVSRVNFSMPTGDTRLIRMIRPITASEVADGFALLRENDVAANGGSEPILVSGYGTSVVLRNHFDIRGQNNVPMVRRNWNQRSFSLNNTLYSNRPVGIFGDQGASQEAWFFGNSIDLDTTLKGSRSAITSRASRLYLIDNAARLGPNDFVDTYDGATLGASTVTIRNNHVAPSAGFFLSQGTGASPAIYGDAIALGACGSCVDEGGNDDFDPDFVDTVNGDFDLSPTSPSVDAGADPTSLVPYYATSPDIFGSARPLDGDGVGGAQWDVGAAER